MFITLPRCSMMRKARKAAFSGVGKRGGKVLPTYVPVGDSTLAPHYRYSEAELIFLGATLRSKK
jgi:hypothetical protein